jgi:hypothetical protein
MNETFNELFAPGYQARREDRLADSRAIFIEAVRKASIEADRPSLAEALCGLAQVVTGMKVQTFYYPPAAATVLIRHRLNLPDDQTTFPRHFQEPPLD